MSQFIKLHNLNGALRVFNVADIVYFEHVEAWKDEPEHTTLYVRGIHPKSGGLTPIHVAESTEVIAAAIQARSVE